MSKENSNAKESEGEAGTEKEGKENGSGKEPGKERIGEESRNLGWYRRRGYEEFRVSLIRGFRFGRDGGWAMAVRMVMVFRRRWLGLAWLGVVWYRIERNSLIEISKIRADSTREPVG